jgi:hypothetical protein
MTMSDPTTLTNTTLTNPMTMNDPALDLATVRVRQALERQRLALAGARSRLDFAMQSRVPPTSTAAWRGIAQQAEARAVGELYRALDSALDAIDRASAATSTAIATLDARVS